MTMSNEQEKYEAPRRSQTHPDFLKSVSDKQVPQRNRYYEGLCKMEDELTEKEMAHLTYKPKIEVWENPKFEKGFWLYLDEHCPDVMMEFVKMNPSWKVWNVELLNYELFNWLWEDKNRMMTLTGARLDGRDVIYHYLHLIGYEESSEPMFLRYLRSKNAI